MTALLDQFPEELNHEQVAVTLPGAVTSLGESQGEAFLSENTVLSGSLRFSRAVTAESLERELCTE